MKVKVKVREEVELNINGTGPLPLPSIVPFDLFPSFILFCFILPSSHNTPNRPKMKNAHIILVLFKAFMVSESSLKDTRAKVN